MVFVCIVDNFINCVRMMYYYLADLIFPAFIIFVIGDAVVLVYIAIYWRYTTERRSVRRTLLVALAVLFVLSLYAVLGGTSVLGQSYHSVTNTLGFAADIVAICLYGAPMEKIYLVLKHKSAAYFQTHMVIAGALNNALWATYGILLGDWFIIAPNSLSFALSSTALVLCIVYNPKTHPLILHDGELPAKSEADMSVSIIATPTKVENGLDILPSPCFEPLQSPMGRLLKSSESLE